MSHRGAAPRNAASIRRTAADSGGKPFHFAHSVVNKDQNAGGEGPPGEEAGKNGKAAAHMNYIERDEAVEKAATLDRSRDRATRDGSKCDASEREQRRDDGSWDREPGHGRAPSNTGADSSGPAQQGYIENPAKLATGEALVFSFGTIGDTIESRKAFWEALEKTERKDGRVQHRLILELPHEATPRARREMIDRFCDKFREDGVPFWAALHAPGPKNDVRNFHAHVVYSERRAKRMIDSNDGEEKWDFEVETHYVDSQRHRKIRFEYKQKKIRDYNGRDFIPGLRRNFAEIVTGICDRDGVRDANGRPVRYDPRSYADMGLDVVPLQSIRRIVADKLKKGAITVLDQDYTRKTIEAQLREAAARREPKLLALGGLESALGRLARQPASASRINRDLPRDLRVAAASLLMPGMIRARAKDILSARRAEIQVDELERATTETLRAIERATKPEVIAAARQNTRDAATLSTIVDPAAAALLHAAALEMLAETEDEAKAARARVRGRLAAATAAWTASADPARYGGNAAAQRQEIEPAGRTPDSEALTNFARGPGERGQARALEADEAVADQHPASSPPTAKPARLNDETAAVAAATQSRTIVWKGREVGADVLIRAMSSASARREAPAGPKMPGAPIMPGTPKVPDLGALREVSAAISGMFRHIAETYPTAEERMTVIEAMTPAGRKHRIERLERERREQEAGGADLEQPNESGGPASSPDAAARSAGPLPAPSALHQELAGSRPRDPPNGSAASPQPTSPHDAAAKAATGLSDSGDGQDGSSGGSASIGEPLSVEAAAKRRKDKRARKDRKAAMARRGRRRSLGR